MAPPSIPDAARRRRVFVFDDSRAGSSAEPTSSESSPESSAAGQPPPPFVRASRPDSSEPRSGGFSCKPPPLGCWRLQRRVDPFGGWPAAAPIRPALVPRQFVTIFAAPADNRRPGSEPASWPITTNCPHRGQPVVDTQLQKPLELSTVIHSAYPVNGVTPPPTHSVRIHEYRMKSVRMIMSARSPLCQRQESRCPSRRRPSKSLPSPATQHDIFLPTDHNDNITAFDAQS